MATRAVLLLLAAVLLPLAASTSPTHHHRRQQHHHDCGPCDESACEAPTDCLAGLVKDSCDCCLVCARREGERCDHPTVKTDHTFGACGEQLECRINADLKAEDPPEAICFCRHSEVICGSDGKTYHNRCQLTEQAYKRRDGLKVKSRGPCRSVPWIVTGPDDASEKVGSNLALACEAMGFPIPSIEWHVTRTDGTKLELPSDNQHVAVQARGGPEQFEITGWLQLLEIEAQDDGVYDCVAKNEEGEARSSARVTVIRDSSDENSVDE